MRGLAGSSKDLQGREGSSQRRQRSLSFPFMFVSHLLHLHLEREVGAGSTLGHNSSPHCVCAACQRQAGHPGLGILCPEDIANNKAILFFSDC